MTQQEYQSFIEELRTLASSLPQTGLHFSQLNQIIEEKQRQFAHISKTPQKHTKRESMFDAAIAALLDQSLAKLVVSAKYLSTPELQTSITALTRTIKDAVNKGTESAATMTLITRSIDAALHHPNNAQAQLQLTNNIERLSQQTIDEVSFANLAATLVIGSTLIACMALTSKNTSSNKTALAMSLIKGAFPICTSKQAPLLIALQKIAADIHGSKANEAATSTEAKSREQRMHYIVASGLAERTPYHKIIATIQQFAYTPIKQLLKLLSAQYHIDADITDRSRLDRYTTRGLIACYHRSPILYFPRLSHQKHHIMIADIYEELLARGEEDLFNVATLCAQEGMGEQEFLDIVSHHGHNRETVQYHLNKTGFNWQQLTVTPAESSRAKPNKQVRFNFAESLEHTIPNRDSDTFKDERYGPSLR